jgi:hypothetical protein
MSVTDPQRHPGSADQAAELGQQGIVGRPHFAWWTVDQIRAHLPMRIGSRQPVRDDRTWRRSAGSKGHDNPPLTLTTWGCHHEIMNDTRTSDEIFQRIKRVRAQALEHTRLAQKLAVERRDLMRVLIKDGMSQSDIARELGVTRQAIQKMLAC